jgi:hypothetical protein
MRLSVLYMRYTYTYDSVYNNSLNFIKTALSDKTIDALAVHVRTGAALK